MISGFAAYGGLFFVAMAAGSLVPIPSEAAFVALLLTSKDPFWIALAVATIGNVIGSVINWLLGRGVSRFKNKRWFPVSEKALERGRAWYHKYGRWSLLASFIPIIGDPLTVVAGVMREPLWTFIILVTIAKFSRYAVFAALTLGWL